jgi:serine/threonine-protein kinase
MENNGQERFEIPDLLGPYRIRRELARGGMGLVYVAEDTRLEREIVIKVLPANLLDDEERQVWFEREAKLLASLNHPNIATIHSFEQIEGVRFITLELIPGASLDKHIQKGALSVERTLAIGLQITRGLEAAHVRGVVHRDLKPSNVQVTPDGEVKILDFGLAVALGSPASERIDGTGAVGTPGYASPEQLLDLPVDERTDLWSLGCILMECLTGEAAFLRRSVSESVTATFREGPPMEHLPKETPEGLRELIKRCLETEVGDRLDTAAKARQMIERDAASPERIRQDVADTLGRALLVGDPAPDFELENARGAQVASRSLLEKGPLVVCFYRGVW